MKVIKFYIRDAHWIYWRNPELNSFFLIQNICGIFRCLVSKYFYSTGLRAISVTLKLKLSLFSISWQIENRFSIYKIIQTEKRENCENRKWEKQPGRCLNN